MAMIRCLDCKQSIAYMRGVCQRCYSRHAQRIKAGTATDAGLIAAGLRAVKVDQRKQLRKRVFGKDD